MNERQPHDDKNDAQVPEHECDIAPEREERAAHPRIYVASLADYNDGRLHGAWIDAAQDVQALRRCIQNMLDASPSPGAEEWAIHDYEGFEFVQLSEFESIETVSRAALGIAEHVHRAQEYLFGRDARNIERVPGSQIQHPLHLGQ